MVKTRRSLNTRGKSGPQLSDFLELGVLSCCEELVIKDVDGTVLFNAVLTGDGWVEDKGCEEKFPDISSWIHTLLQGHDSKKKDARKKLRALVRSVKDCADDDEMGDDEEEELCLWQCVHISSDGCTLAEARKTLSKRQEEQRMQRECVTQMSQSLELEMNREDDADDKPTQADKHEELVPEKEARMDDEPVPEKQEARKVTLKKKRQSSGRLEGETKSKKRRIDGDHGDEEQEVSTAPIVKAFQRVPQSVERQISNSSLPEGFSFGRSPDESSSVPTYQPLPVVAETLYNDDFSLDGETQPPYNAEEDAEDCGVVESTLCESKCGEKILARMGSRTGKNGVPSLYGEQSDARCAVPSAMNVPEKDPSPVTEEKQESYDASEDDDDFEAPPPTMLCAEEPPSLTNEKEKLEMGEEEQEQGEKEKDGSMNPVVVGTSMNPELMVHLAMTVKKLGGRVSREFDEKTVTHVVVSTNESGIVNARTGKYEQGLVTGKWVLSFQWVLDSFAALRWLPEEKYVVRGDKFSVSQREEESPVLKARRALQQGKPPLFHGMEFLISSEVSEELGRTLADIIVAGGGVLLDKTPPPPKCTEEILAGREKGRSSITESASVIRVLAPKETTSAAAAQKLYIETGRHPLSCEYVMDCVSSYSLLPTVPYELELFEEGGAMSDLNNVEPSLRF